MITKYWGVGTMMGGMDWTTTDENEARTAFKNFTRDEMWDKDDEAHLYYAEVDEKDLVDEDGYVNEPDIDLFDCPESYTPESYSFGSEVEVYCLDPQILPTNKPFQAVKRQLNSAWFGRGHGHPTKAVLKYFYEIDGNLYDADNFVEF